jgi:hypothetical protein
MRLLYRGMPERHTPAACPGAAGPPIADESRCSLSPPYRRSRALWPVSPASRRVATIRLVMPPSPPTRPRRRDVGTGRSGRSWRTPDGTARRRDAGTGRWGPRSRPTLRSRLAAIRQVWAAWPPTPAPPCMLTGKTPTVLLSAKPKHSKHPSCLRKQSTLDSPHGVGTLHGLQGPRCIPIGAVLDGGADSLSPTHP